MISKMTVLFVLVLSLVLFLIPSCSPKKNPAVEEKPVRYRESPMLKEQVQKGLLPPVEERLPENPLVVEPVERVGVYSSAEDESEDEKKSP
jgi:hypothetical protein